MSNYKKEHFKELNEKSKIIIAGLPEACKDFFVAMEDSISKNTKLSYATQLKIFFSYMVENNSYLKTKGMRNISLDDINMIKPKDIEQFLYDLEEFTGAKKEIAVSTKNHYIATLSSFFKYLYSHEYIDHDPVSAVRRKKNKKKRVVYLDDNERKEFIDTVSTVPKSRSGHISAKKTRDTIRNTAIVKLFLSTGIRVSELVGLDVNDINWNEHSITVDRKGGDRDPDVFYSDEAEIALKDYMTVRDEYKHDEKEPALFLSSKTASRMSVRGIQNMVEKIAKTADIGEKKDKLSVHKLRSSFAAHRLANNGQDLMDVKNALNHESIESTMHYVPSKTREERRKNRNL